MKVSYRNRWYHFIWRWLYSFILLCLLPLLFLKLLTKKADTSTLTDHKNRQRFGLLPKHWRKDGIVIHCVSMGEINAAKGVIDGLLLRYPNSAITLTTTSVTGAAHAKRLYPQGVQHCFLPIDFPWCVALFLRQLQPRLLIVTEVEIWPNLLHQCYRKQIPAILINARMTSRSVNNYKRIAYLFRPSLRKFTTICAQSIDDFDRFIELGVYKDHLYLTNNLKFDLQANPADEDAAIKLIDQFNLHSKNVILAASTHENEEKILLAAYAKLKDDFPDTVLMVVPRYPHRFEEVTQMIKASGFSVSNLSSASGSPQHDLEVAVVDEMGMLTAAYKISHMAFVGGSLVDKGGHNALEGALYSVPMCMGNSTFNNPVITAALQQSQALVHVASSDDIYALFYQWLTDPIKAKNLGEQGNLVLKAHAGAVDKTINKITALLDPH